MTKLTMIQREAIVREAIAKRDAIAAGSEHAPSIASTESVSTPGDVVALGGEKGEAVA